MIPYSFYLCGVEKTWFEFLENDMFMIEENGY